MPLSQNLLLSPKQLAKCGKPTNAIDLVVKRLKPNERHNVTQSESRATSFPPPSNASQSDVFDEETDFTVSRLFMTCHLSLITAPADQRECHTICKQLLKTMLHRIIGPSPEPDASDQQSCVYIADSLSSKISCSSIINAIPTLHLWLLALMTLCCCINTTFAAPSATGSLSLFVLNTNSFVHPMKIDATNRVISHMVHKT